MYGINGKQDVRKYLLVKIMYSTISINVKFIYVKNVIVVNRIISIIWYIEAISKNENFY